MKFLEKISFFYVLDKKIWKNKIEPNQYFATLCILIAALGGALCGGNDIFRSTSLGWDFHVSLIGTIGICIILWGLNVAESIVASTSPLTAFARSLLILVVLALSIAIGYAVAVIVMVIVCIVAALLLLGGFVTALVGSGKKYTLVDTSTGEKKEVTDMGLNGFLTGDGELIPRQQVENL